MEDRKSKDVPVWARVSIGLLLALCTYGCASKSYPTVPKSSAGVIQTLSHGTVVAVRTVQIDGQSTILGPTAGATVGAAVGRTAGQGSGQILASAAGAAVGGIVGAAVEKKLTTKQAQEVTIRMDGGERVTVVQEFEEPGFHEGDRVNVMESINGDARISHADYLVENHY